MLKGNKGGGHTFSRHIYNLMGTVKERHYKIRMNAGVREDISWWLQFARHFNGKARILKKFSPVIATYSDASKWGFGAMHGCDWLAGTFVQDDKDDLLRYLGHHYVSSDNRVDSSHINVQEMWAVYAAALRWSANWSDCTVLMITDSSTVLGALNTGRSRSPEIMFYLRRLFWMAILNNFNFLSIYIRSRDNNACDALSRLDSKDSAGRLRMGNPNTKLCCRDIFDVNFSAYRGSSIERTKGIPSKVVCP